MRVPDVDMVGRSPEPGSAGQALRLVTEIRQRWPDHILAQRALGHYLYTVEDDYAGALEAYQPVVAERPNDIVSVVNVRNAYKRLDRRADFLYWSRRAVEISPESQIIADEHVRALLANRRLAEAMDFIEASVERFPEDSTWKNTAARHRLWLFGDVEAYLEAGERLRAEGQWAELGELSWIYYARGDLELALAHLEARRGEDYGLDSVDADTEEALILMQEGRATEAQALAERAHAFLAPLVDEMTTRPWYWKQVVLGTAQAAALA